MISLVATVLVDFTFATTLMHAATVLVDFTEHGMVLLFIRSQTGSRIFAASKAADVTRVFIMC